jgi:hypothetical protein
MTAGSSTISLCATSVGCASVSVSVIAPTQTISFSQAQAYVMVGQPSSSISIYGPGSYYGLTDTNKDIVSASISGTSLVLQGLAVGQVTVSVCGDAWICGSIVVNSVSSGTAIPTQTMISAPLSTDTSKTPQLSSLSISSNDVLGAFYGSGSTINLSFGINQTVTNVQAKIAGQSVSLSQGNNGTYYASYSPTGNEILPLPVVLSFTNSAGKIGQIYFWLGNSSKLPTSGDTTSSASTETFSSYLYEGITEQGVSNTEVVALQKRLKSDGYFTGSVTGYFGPLTKAALESYQTKNGLSAVGVVGPSTRALLNKGI